MKKITFFLTAIILFFGVIGGESVYAQRKITVKLASLVPESTPWGAKLNQLARDWGRITNGRVEMIVYHNGVAGNEADVIRKLKVNQIQGAVLTSFGLKDYVKEIMTLSTPFLIKDEQELDLVLAEVKPDLNNKFLSQGVYPLVWTKAGWAKVFTKEQVKLPPQLKRLKIANNPDEPEMERALKAIGYTNLIAVPSYGDLLTFLRSGSIEALYQSPIYAASMQLFGVAGNMMSINLAPIMGGIVINYNTWRSIPDEFKPALIENARRLELDMNGQLGKLEDDAISTMIRYGLNIVQLTPEEEQEWYKDVERAIPAMLENVLDKDLYRRIESILNAHRNRR
jgi:TRAP-type C4-dicarboxylate transport system substrate-binding protein